MDTKRARLAAIVGQDGIIDNPSIEQPFSLDQILRPPLAPSFLVKPRNVDEVQEIVLWANETLTPLVPVSSGGPRFRGDTLPTAPESVMVDLSNMKRILKIDRRNRLALIEPGVTYGQLQPELEEAGLRLIMPLLPRRSKSIIASLLEREPIMSPRYQWNLGEPLRSLEIVWGNGDKFYSGGGTFRGEREEDWQQGLVPVLGPGPGQLDFYKLISAAQGSMGIVTWASVKCEVHPGYRKLFLVPAGRLEDLIDFTYRLLRFRFGDELFILNDACLAYILSPDAAGIASLQHILPAWTVVVGITGGQILPRERIRAREEDIHDIAQQFGLKMVPAVPGCRGGDLLEMILSPSAEPYWKLRAKGGVQEIFFLHCEFILPFDPNSEAEVQRAADLFRDASHRLFDQKAYFSRPYGLWADMVYNADARTTIVTRKMKGIFDPNHVMNPGKLCF
jgi:FAD/FMN-containing dehydrogenase